MPTQDLMDAIRGLKIPELQEMIVAAEITHKATAAAGLPAHLLTRMTRTALTTLIAHLMNQPVILLQQLKTLQMIAAKKNQLLLVRDVSLKT